MLQKTCRRPHGPRRPGKDVIACDIQTMSIWIFHFFHRTQKLAAKSEKTLCRGKMLCIARRAHRQLDSFPARKTADRER